MVATALDWSILVSDLSLLRSTVVRDPIMVVDLGFAQVACFRDDLMRQC